MKSITPTRLAALLALAAVSASTARAVLLDPVYTNGDGYIRYIQDASGTGTNNVNNNVMLIGDAAPQSPLFYPNDELRGVMNFSLTAPELIGATINSVTLVLHIQQPDNTSQNSLQKIQLYNLTESFTEAATTWGSRDGSTDWTTAGGTLGSLLQTVDLNPRSVTNGQQVDFGTSASFVSVTQSAIGGDLGLLLKLETFDAIRSIFRFDAKGSSTLATRPYLLIDYTPVPEPASYATIAGLALLGFAGTRRRRAA